MTYYWVHRASMGELHNQCTCTYASTIIHRIQLVRIHIIYIHLCSIRHATCVLHTTYHIGNQLASYLCKFTKHYGSVQVALEVHKLTQWTATVHVPNRSFAVAILITWFLINVHFPAILECTLWSISIVAH